MVAVSKGRSPMKSFGLTIGVVLGLLAGRALAQHGHPSTGDNGSGAPNPLLGTSGGFGDTSEPGGTGEAKGSGTGMADHTFAPGLYFFGNGTPGCGGFAELGANAPPFLGDPLFAFTCTGAPPSSFGIVLLADVPCFAGADPLGLGVWFYLDFAASTQVAMLGATSDANGFATAPVPIPADPALEGAVVYAQAFWYWGSWCPTAPLSSSSGLEVTLMKQQP